MRAPAPEWKKITQGFGNKSLLNGHYQQTQLRNCSSILLLRRLPANEQVERSKDAQSSSITHTEYALRDSIKCFHAPRMFETKEM